MDISNISFLPVEIKAQLEISGILSLKEFQLEGIQAGLNGENVLIVAPTGAGKTLIGEIIGVLKVINHKGKVLYLVPYKALAEELYNTFKLKYPFIRFGIGTGDYLDKPNELLGRDGDFLIVTYEKADSIVRNPPSWFNNLKLVIVDEVHLISDYERGPIIDNVLTHCLRRGIQIIALSATIPNPEDLSKWLNAKLVISRNRPVKLIEGVYLQKNRRIYVYDPSPNLLEEIYVKNEDLSKKLDKQAISLDSLLGSTTKELKVELTKVGEIKKISRNRYRDELVEKLSSLFSSECHKKCFYYLEVPRRSGSKRGFMGAVIDLINETFNTMKKYGVKWQVLVFRKSRRLAQITAKNIAEFMKKSKLDELFPEAIQVSKSLLGYIDETTPLTEELSRYLKHGVAFHHAGLSHRERTIIEQAFRTRKIGVIVATPTLAAGINLPARRVIIEHKFYRGVDEEISVASYKQRSGRAGRPGFDTLGEAILIANDEDEVIYLYDKYIFGELEHVESKLGANLPALRDQTLALIVSSNKTTKKEIKKFFESTFYAYKQKMYFELNDDNFLENIDYVIEDLINWGFVRKENRSLISTEIGRLISKIYLDPLTAHIIIKFLNKKRKVNVIDVLFMILSTPDLSNYRIRALSLLRKSVSIYEKLNLLSKDVMKILQTNKIELLNILEYLASGFQLFLTAEEENDISTLVLLILLLLWIEGIPIRDILGDLTPQFGAGDFLEMLRSVNRLLYCTIEISKKIKKSKRIIDELYILRERIDKGVPQHLLELTKIPMIGRVRAQILFKNGYIDLRSLAKASVSELAKLPNIGRKIAEQAIKYARGVVEGTF